ncbi:TPA: hypothetical protein LA462_001849 [Clostridium botulinum]|nr:hypothetical protein [Clostridium botulinum]
MAKRSNLYSKLKELTGCSYEKIAKEYQVEIEKLENFKKEIMESGMDQ